MEVVRQTSITSAVKDPAPIVSPIFGVKAPSFLEVDAQQATSESIAKHDKPKKDFEEFKEFVAMPSPSFRPSLSKSRAIPIE